MASVRLIQANTSGTCHVNENKLDLESHPETIFCDMISPDEWKSSLPLVFQQDDMSLMTNSINSPSDSIENLVLQLETSQEVEASLPVYQGILPEKVSPTVDPGLDDDVTTAVESNSVIYREMMDPSEQHLYSSEAFGFGMKQTEIFQFSTLKPAHSDNLSIKSTLEINNAKTEVDSTSTASSSEIKRQHTSSSDCKAQSLSPISVKRSKILSPTKPKPKKQVPNSSQTVQKLTGRLAKVAHCNTSDDVSVLQKATSTISTLRKQARDLMSTYSQLKYENDQLIQKQNDLHAAQRTQSESSENECLESSGGKRPLMIEVLIPSRGSETIFDSAPKYHHIPIEGGAIPSFYEDEALSSEEITEEPYEEQYDAQPNFDPTFMTSDPPVCLNGKPVCQLGCICSSLESGKIPANHCKNPMCMLEPECTQPEDPSHTPIVLKTILTNIELRNDDNQEGVSNNENASENGRESRSHSRLSSVSRSKESSKLLRLQKPRRPRNSSTRNRKQSAQIASKPSLDDEKLRQKCVVRLFRLDSETLKGKLATLDDIKLHSKCCVRLHRLKTKKDQPVYCMDHEIHQCICLKSIKD